MKPKKIAIFVEGQTEQIFVAKLLEEMAGQKNISIKIYKFQGGKSRRNVQLLENRNIKNSPFFALLYDCDSESHVLSDIRSQHQSLTQSNYEKIIGLKDLYPDLLENRKKIEDGMKGFIKPLKKTGIPVYMILAIMEIEAWFLAEYTCFAKIDQCLTSEFILQNCQLDLMNVEIETILHPSSELDKIYQLIDQNYTKNKEQVQNIVEYIDYELIYLDLINKVKQLNRLIKEIDEFLSQPIP